MALGNSFTNTLKTIVCKLKIKGGARFEVSEKTENGTYEDKGTTNQVSGNFTGVFTRKSEYEGNIIYNYNISLVDEESGERYSVDMGFSSLGRSVANCLLTLEDGYRGPINISVYKKGEYDNIAIRKGDELMKWFLPYDKQDEMVEKATLKGKTIRDYDKLNEFLFTKLEEKFGKRDKQPMSEGEISVEDIPF